MAFALGALVAVSCSGSASPGPTSSGGGRPTGSSGSSAPASVPASPAPAAGPVVLLVHGFAPTAAGYSCAAYWAALELA